MREREGEENGENPQDCSEQCPGWTRRLPTLSRPPPWAPPKDEPHLQDRLCAQGELLPGELLQLGLVLDSDLFFLSLRAC